MESGNSIAKGKGKATINAGDAGKSSGTLRLWARDANKSRRAMDIPVQYRVQNVESMGPLGYLVLHWHECGEMDE